MSTTRASLAIDPCIDQRSAIGSEPMVHAIWWAAWLIMAPTLRAKFWACQAQFSAMHQMPERSLWACSRSRDH